MTARWSYFQGGLKWASASIGIAPLARAQYPVSVVADPIAVANQIQNIAKWTQSIAYLDQQLQQALTLAQQMKVVVGNFMQWEG